MLLTVQQVLDLAPDAASAAAGRKLATPGPWKSVGRDSQALWGECQGSALYQVRVEAGAATYKCSCPSRKFPCKHVLGLMLLAAGQQDAVPQSAPPQWVSDWLQKRADAAERKAAKAANATAGPQQAGEAQTVTATDRAPADKAKRTARRDSRIASGLDRLDLWLSDLAHNGMAGVETQPFSFWDGMARSLVDAQAPGLAARVRAMATMPGSGPDWPSSLAQQLGRLALLSHAYRRLEQLDPALQHDVRAMVGWTLDQAELEAVGQCLADQWLVLGQFVEEEERLRVQRSWLQGRASGRMALVLQFSAARAPFPEIVVPGTIIDADLLFYPGAWPQRARIAGRRGTPTPITGAVSGSNTAAEHLASIAEALRRQPFLERFGCVLTGFCPARTATGDWAVCDAGGAGLPLRRGEHWHLLALSGGGPIDVAGEWNGERLRPLGVMKAGRYMALPGDSCKPA